MFTDWQSSFTVSIQSQKSTKTQQPFFFLKFAEINVDSKTYTENLEKPKQS